MTQLTPEDVAALQHMIDELRRLINEPNEPPWTDVDLAVRLLENPDVPIRSLAASIWREKAASYASLVDIQEGNSSRKMSQLYSQALKMADGLDLPVDSSLPPARRSARTRPIERM